MLRICADMFFVHICRDNIYVYMIYDPTCYGRDNGYDTRYSIPDICDV